MKEPIVATKETVKKVFDGAAARYDRVGPNIFQQFGARLVELMAIDPGASVLDIATGAGAVLIPAARRAGSKGRVIGTDLSSVMLREAERTFHENGITNYQLLPMDAEHLEFPDRSFDVVTCGFALFLFHSMDQCLREIYRALKPGGRFGATMWGKAPFDPAWKMFAEQVREYGVEVRMPHKVAYAAEELQTILSAGKFVDIDIREEKIDAIYETAEDWWQFQLTTGGRAAIERMDSATRARFKDEYLAKLQPLFQADGLHLPAPAIFALARKANHGE